MENVKSIFASRTVWASLVAVLALLASKAGYTVAGADQAAIVDAVMTVVGALSSVAAIYFRSKATKVIAKK